jgi:hypothetical protein
MSNDCRMLWPLVSISAEIMAAQYDLTTTAPWSKRHRVGFAIRVLRLVEELASSKLALHHSVFECGFVGRRNRVAPPLRSLAPSG